MNIWKTGAIALTIASAVVPHWHATAQEATCSQLCDAASNGNEGTVRDFLSSNTDPDFINARDSRGRTPLFLAARGNHANIVEQLLSANPAADANIRNNAGRSPLMWAAEHRNSSMIANLVNSGEADLNYARDRDSYVALDFVLNNLPTPGHSDNNAFSVFKLLADNGAIVSDMAHESSPVFSHLYLTLQDIDRNGVVYRRYEDILKNLVEHNGDVNYAPSDAGSDGYTALHYAALHGGYGLAYALKQVPGLDETIRLAQTDSRESGYTPWMLAVLHGYDDNSEEVGYLIRPTSGPINTIRYGILNRDNSVFAVLATAALEADGTEFEFADEESPMFYAAKNNNVSLATALYTDNPDSCYAQDSADKFPADYARDNSNTEVLAYLHEQDCFGGREPCQANAERRGVVCVCVGEFVEDPADATRCILDCEDDEIANSDGSACIECEANEVISNGRCVQCQGNTGADNGRCVPCEANEVPEDGVCEACPSDKVVSNRQCVSCEGNSVARNNQCVSCENNSVARNNSCAPCPSNQVVSGTSCVFCSGNMGADNGRCVPCEANEVPMNGVCEACPSDKAVSNRQCVSCEGNSIAVNGECVSCEGNLLASSSNTCVCPGNLPHFYGGACHRCTAGQLYTGGQCRTPPQAGCTWARGSWSCPSPCPDPNNDFCRGNDR